MLNIKRAETYDLARQLAEATGTSMADAVTEAIREKLAQVDARHRSDVEARVGTILDLARQWREAMGPELKGRAELDAELYDDNGLPR